MSTTRVLAYLPSLLHAEIIGRLEGTISIVIRNVDLRVAESDNVSSLVPCEIGDITRVLVDCPFLGGSKVVENEVDGNRKYRFLIGSKVDSCITTANDIDCQVRVSINAPTTNAIAKVIDD